jgi:hypothetical protein
MKKLVAFAFAMFVAAVAYGQTNLVVPFDAARRFSSNIRTAPTYVNARVLAANVSESVVMPAAVRFVIFSSTCNFYAKLGGTAAVPGADITDGTASELNPTAYYFNVAAPTISVITPDATCVVTVSGYLGPVN